MFTSLLHRLIVLISYNAHRYIEEYEEERKGRTEQNKRIRKCVYAIHILGISLYERYHARVISCKSGVLVIISLAREKMNT
jgi:hypothetical protein